MKKTLLFLAIISSNFVLAQITLENSFPVNETIFTYTTDTELYYISEVSDNTIKIYNSDFTINKIVDIPISIGYDYTIWYDSDYYPLISKHIFNTDDKFEFLVKAFNGSLTKLLLIDEDGNLIKDFHTDADYSFGNYYQIFHDPINNNNKFLVRNISNIDGNIDYDDVYSLPTSTLGTEKINSVNKFTAFPVPTSKTLYLINPKNGSTSLELYDINGKKVLDQKISNIEDRISLDVENLSSGIYIYKIGNLSSKFIKD